MSIADRQPAGSPTGGQFAPAPHAEADIDLEQQASLGHPGESDVTVAAERARGQTELQEFLDGVDTYNASGTYSFPPRPRDPCQVETFWHAVQIPDTVLAQFQAAYPEARQRSLTSWVNHATACDPEPKLPFLGPTKKYNSELAQWQQRRAAKAAELAVHLGPPTLADHEVRTAVRFIMKARDIRTLPRDERCRFVKHTNGEIYDMVGPPTSYALIEQFYAADQMLKSVFRDPGIDVAARMTELTSTMRAVHEKVAAMRDSQELDAATAGARTDREVVRMARAAGFTQR